MDQRPLFKIWKITKGKYREKHLAIGMVNNFLGISPTAQKNSTKIIIWCSMKIKGFYIPKGTISRARRKCKEWENLLAPLR